MKSNETWPHVLQFRDRSVLLGPIGSLVCFRTCPQDFLIRLSQCFLRRPECTQFSRLSRKSTRARGGYLTTKFPISTIRRAAPLPAPGKAPTLVVCRCAPSQPMYHCVSVAQRAGLSSPSRCPPSPLGSMRSAADASGPFQLSKSQFVSRHTQHGRSLVRVLHLRASL